MAAFLIGKTARLDLREAGGSHPLPAVGSVDPVGVDEWDPRDQATAASDDHRFVNGQLAEPADLDASEFWNMVGPQASDGLLLLRSTRCLRGTGATLPTEPSSSRPPSPR